ncbi:glycerophosphodiester phosphodiesterase family protein [Shewanella sp. NIFS-20-20]|uniref:glycerophosphodiester phosphodiesterase n=1 Tax=Shewanella sp. NIFS-20-20 TaxID=2853806 RepID=UPI001C44CE47|nr:glycerophosphodiester phosphodiesterase family protein [Shewanella sp. NIFS-20-20]MBV7316556.1 glycerophosphodiester phosphodiesterase [Shewanella sp. NIFS-20-20]
MTSFLSTVARTFAIGMIALLALAGCQTPPPSTMTPKPIPGALRHLPMDAKFEGADILDIQLALNDRNLYLADNGTIKMLTISQCRLDISAHRGDFRFPESSQSAIAAALLDNFTSVEIDVMQLGDGTWVNHHDSQTGRASVHYTGERLTLKRMTRQQFNQLKLRDKLSNDLVDMRPITAYEAFETFAAYQNGQQQLNVEIKSEANGHDLALLDSALRHTVGQGNYYYSSSHLATLKKFRGINPQVYLGFVQGSHPTSVERLKALLQQGASHDGYYQDNQHSLEIAAGVGSKRYRSRYKNYASGSGLKTLFNALGEHSGLHLDIRSLRQHPQVVQSAKRYGMKVYSYSINGTNYHQQQLMALSHHERPHGVIVDTTPYQICQKLFNSAQPTGQYQATTAAGQYITSLPSDSDFDRFDEMLAYQNEGYYIALSGSLKAIKSPVLAEVIKSSSDHPVAVDAHGFPIIVDEHLDTSTSTTIILTLPRSQNDR